MSSRPTRSTPAGQLVPGSLSVARLVFKHQRQHNIGRTLVGADVIPPADRPAPAVEILRNAEVHTRIDSRRIPGQVEIACSRLTKHGLATKLLVVDSVPLADSMIRIDSHLCAYGVNRGNLICTLIL